MINTSELEEKLHANGYEDEKMADIMPKLEEINRLRTEKNAVILAHYYQIAPIQLIADIRGDSLALAMAARNLAKDKRLVVSSTVHFMAEMIKLLNPDRKIVIPDPTASCSIAEGMNASVIRKIKEFYPSSGIVAYINTNAEVKAEVDTVCTSANAEKIMRAVPGNPVIMVPDYYFARNVLADMQKKGLDGREYLAYRGITAGRIILEDLNARDTKLPIRNSDAPILNRGICIVHENFTPVDILEQKERGLDLVLAHPEVKPEIARYADMVGGTNRMINYLKSKPNAKKILFITECDMATPLREAYPEKEFITPCRLCPYMKKNDLDKLTNALKNEAYEINVDPHIAEKAKKSLERMFQLMGEKI